MLLQIYAGVGCTNAWPAPRPGGELILLGGVYSPLVQGWAESFAVGSVILGLHGVILSRIWSLAGKRLKNVGNGGKKAKGR